MIRALSAVFLLAAGWTLSEERIERLRWNVRERTRAAVEALENQNPEQALHAFETAVSLSSSDPTIRYNAGSGHLLAGSDAASAHLEAAAASATDALRTKALYNLGNSRLQVEDPAGAIEAYEECLRTAPDFEEAKFNLELALQQQEQQESQEQENQDPPQDDQEQKEEPQDQPSEGNQDEPDEQQEQQDKGQDEPSDFEDQPDMTAEQAAAILEAVENMEREHRRQEAREQQKKRAKKGKDW